MINTPLYIVTKFFQPKIKTHWHLTMEQSWGDLELTSALLRNSQQFHRNSVQICTWFDSQTQKQWFFFFFKFWGITVSEQNSTRSSLGLWKMSNGPLTFYFLWVSGLEALEDIFFFHHPCAKCTPTPGQRVQLCSCRSPTPAEANQTESQNEKNELVRCF